MNEFALQSNVTELVEAEVGGETISASAEQQLEQPQKIEPCGRPVSDNLDHLPSSTLGQNDSTLTHAERVWLTRYPSIDRLQLAELREAFLMLAVGNELTMTPRTAMVTADSARMDAADIGTCLRAVGQNPTLADVSRITATVASRLQQQQQHPEGGSGGGAGGLVRPSNHGPSPRASNRHMQAATKLLSTAAANRLHGSDATVSSIRQTSSHRPSVEIHTNRVSTQSAVAYSDNRVWSKL